MESVSKYIIFYSWQSDLDRHTNLNAIRNGLRAASNKIESENDDIILHLDESTRNTPGSPEIPTTIFDKIKKSDIFICDVTTINSSDSENRKVPNPNVLIELGYAIAMLGWSRIIMLFNKNFGDFPSDLPFDIDRRRITDYSITSKEDKSGKSQLNSVLQVAIKTIIEHNPIKPTAQISKSEEEIKRDRDVDNINWLFGQIHLPTVDEFLATHPDMFRGKILFFWEGFNGIVKSNLFHLYDKELLNLINEFHSKWDYALSFGAFYKVTPHGDNYIFGVASREKANKEEDEVYKSLHKNKMELNSAYVAFLNYVKESYLEIDIKQTNLKAFSEYKSYSTE